MKKVLTSKTQKTRKMSHGEANYQAYREALKEQGWLRDWQDLLPIEQFAWESGAAAAIHNYENAPRTPDLG